MSYRIQTSSRLHAASCAKTGGWRVRQGQWRLQSDSLWFQEASAEFSSSHPTSSKQLPIYRKYVLHQGFEAIYCHTNSLAEAVSIGGVKYFVASGGKSLQRFGTNFPSLSVANRIPKRTTSATYVVQFFVSHMNITNGSCVCRARATAAIQRARVTRFKGSAVKIRTELCSFYNRFGKCLLILKRNRSFCQGLRTACFSGPGFLCVFCCLNSTGYCNRKNDCKFIHDSRRVAICHKFLRNECSDPKCLLSHRIDQVDLLFQSTCRRCAW